MSRLIVRNLPANFDRDKLAEVFSALGELTDVRICKTKSGKSRRFGFVGFKNEENARKAQQYLNKSYIKTSKIEIEVAKGIGDQTVPRPWSKYSNKSSAFERNSKESLERKERIKQLQEGVHDNGVKGNEKTKQKGDKGKSNKEPKDSELDEFLAAHKKSSVKKTWGNEIADFPATNLEAKTESGDSESRKEKQKISQSKKIIDKESKSEAWNIGNSTTDDESDSNNEEPTSHDTSASNVVGRKSDLKWLKSKVKGESENMVEASDDNDAESSSDGESASSSEDDNSSSTQEKQGKKLSVTVKMRGIPFACTEKQVLAFFFPIKVVDIRIPLDDKKRVKGNAYVDFENEADVLAAMEKDGNKMKKRYIELFRMEDNGSDSAKRIKEESPWIRKVEQQAEDNEPVAESGRLFLRNLSYTCTEDEIRGLFEKYGPIAEVHLPIDKTTKRMTGIGFVTFVMPEHAVKAFNEVDGKVFQGRLLHILPARNKKTNDDEEYSVTGAGSSYKKEKAAKMKSLSSNGHNWNTLFLGQNAVVDVLAQRMNTSKSKILETENADSLAVRMALGETQIVAETREFLMLHGVQLDVFGQANAKKSSTVILVKNLPHGTKVEEIRNTFGKFGDLDSVLLPPSGITAIVQFVQPTEAKVAFRSLAFSKFKHVPLYLEWAPTDVFSVRKTEEEKKDEKVEAEEDEDAEIDEDSGRVLFVKNLNFNTSEDDLRKTFEKCGKLESVTIARKKDPKKPDSLLSMGYGFVEYKKKSKADEAIKTLQHTMLDGHQLELKKSHRKTHASETSRKRAVSKKQKTSKILVRNVPFEASKKEIKQLFGAFGELKTIRLPSKMAGSGSHRGFAFIDYLTKQDAKRAFKSLCQSTHLYGRRLVLEWAEDDDTVDSIRQKTALHFNDGPAKKKSKQDLVEALDSVTEQTPSKD